MRSKMMYDRPIPVQRIVNTIADSKLYSTQKESHVRMRSYDITNSATEAQVNTQQYGRRPYGVGLLVIGYDVSRGALPTGRG